MIVIGLCGGSVESRLQVADQVFGAGRERITLFNPGVNSSEAGRVAGLRDLLSGAEMSRRYDRGLVYTHVKTPSEAALIRQAGGAIWHIQGVPSDAVAIDRADLMVTPKQAGDRHYRHAIEALGEMVIRIRQRQQVA